MKYDVIILGGGAAGLSAAVSLARAGRRVAILEAQNRVGRKLLATGNGRCNFTNISAQPEDYFGDPALALPALEIYPPARVLHFFETLGIPARVDEAGRAYPTSNQAASVLDALRLSFFEAGGEEITGFRVKAIEDGLTAVAEDGRRMQAQYVLLATGGLASPKTGAADAAFVRALGHVPSKRIPTLTPLILTEPMAALKGIRAFCRLMLDEKEETGEILFTEYGISGIAAMQLARFAKPGTQLKIDFLLGRAAKLPVRIKALRERTMDDFLNGIVPKRLGQVLVKIADIPLSKRAKELSEREIETLEALLTGWTLPIKGTKGFDQAQMTAGGFTSEDFDPSTLESKHIPGLFAAGEILDVDGPCGGYNLQWAWASGLLAAKTIKERFKK